MDEQGFRLEDLKSALRRRGRVASFIALGVMLVAILVAAVYPNSYESQTVLLVEPQSVSERLVEPGVPETDINNRLHLIQMQILSRSRLSSIIDDLDVYPELASERSREEVIEFMREQINVAPLLPELATEARAQAGARTVDIAVNTFVLSFQHHSPQIAADVANRLSRDFIDEHIKERVQVSGDTSEFIDAELAGLTARIGAVEERIKDVKAANAGSLPEDFIANQRLYERATMAVRDAQRELSNSLSDEAFYRQQAQLGGGELGHNPNFMNPARRLDILDVHLAELGSRGFTEKHPDVIAARDEILRLRAEIEAGAANDDGYSPAQHSARNEEQRAGLRAASARTELELLRADLAGIEAKLAATPAVAEQLAALDREHKALLDSYQDYSNKRVEASVAAAMESRQKGERFRVLESAYPAISPSSPNRPLILTLGLLMAIAISGTWMLLVEMADDSFHDGQALQDRLGLPVLAGIPDVVLDSDTTRRRARDARHLALAGLATAVVLVIAAAGNWWVNGAPRPIAEIFQSTGE